MKSTLETVAFFKNIRDTLDEMSDADAGALMKALFAHDDGETVDLSQKSPLVRIVFPMIADSMDRLTAKRISKVRKQSATVPQTDRKQSANGPQNAAHNHNHNQSHNDYKRTNSFLDFDQRKPGDPDYKDLDKIVREAL